MRAPRRCIDCGAGLNRLSNGKRCPSCSDIKAKANRAEQKRRAKAKKRKLIVIDVKGWSRR